MDLTSHFGVARPFTAVIGHRRSGWRRSVDHDRRSLRELGQNRVDHHGPYPTTPRRSEAEPHWTHWARLHISARPPPWPLPHHSSPLTTRPNPCWRYRHCSRSTQRFDTRYRYEALLHLRSGLGCGYARQPDALRHQRSRPHTSLGRHVIHTSTRPPRRERLTRRAPVPRISELSDRRVSPLPDCWESGSSPLSGPAADSIATTQ